MATTNTTEKILTWVGPFEGSGAFPSINRHLTAALERLGWTICRNEHTYNGDLTPLLVSCAYPPEPPSLRHARNAILAVWEFMGPNAVPLSFLSAFKAYDTVWAHCAFAGEVFRQNGAQHVVDGFLGVDPVEFRPDGDAWRMQALDDTEHLILWAGGTDARHGFDVAERIIDCLPDNYHLFAKQSVHYPAATSAHPRVHILREDLDSMASLYRSCDLLLHPARATGPSLHVIEALACGLRVVSTDLPAMREYTFYELIKPYLTLVPGRQQPMRHHVHHDCYPYWIEPDLDAMVETVIRTCAIQPRSIPISRARQIGRLFSWDDAALHLANTLEELL